MWFLKSGFAAFILIDQPIGSCNCLYDSYMDMKAIQILSLVVFGVSILLRSINDYR